ncbi:hypothetical protein CES87_26720 [Pseudomonas sp. ERMR1:02]|nr:hypothetical protein CES87_26720 [Pseudomonas sp. ERMR1:02]
MRGFFWVLRRPYPVGASLLAMVVNDDAGCLIPRSDLRLIASRLAPTVDWVHLRISGRLSGRHRWQASSHRKRCLPCRSEPCSRWTSMMTRGA